MFALARPQDGFDSRIRHAEGIDILLSLDTSASMNIEDLGDRARIDIAKETMEKFIEGRGQDRIGIVTFSGEALTVVPPTLDYGLVLTQLRAIQSGVLRDGTAIGDGLALSVQRLRKSSARSRVIVLLTDGESNIGQVDPLTAGELAAGYQMRVYTIAIGKEGRVKVPIKRRGVLGEMLTSYQWMDNALNTELLEKIADRTGAKFFRVTEGEALKKVFAEIDRLERTPNPSTEKIRWEESFRRWALLALALMVLERMLKWWVWRAWI
jgi:Ca-activated chloride channel family protein